MLSEREHAMVMVAVSLYLFIMYRDEAFTTGHCAAPNLFPLHTLHYPESWPKLGLAYVFSPCRSPAITSEVTSHTINAMEHRQEAWMRADATSHHFVTKQRTAGRRLGSYGGRVSFEVCMRKCLF